MEQKAEQSTIQPRPRGLGYPMPVPKRKIRQDSRFQYPGLCLPLPLCPTSLPLPLLIPHIFPSPRHWTCSYLCHIFPKMSPWITPSLAPLSQRAGFLTLQLHTPCPHHMSQLFYYLSLHSWVSFLSSVLKGIPQAIEEFILLCAQHRDLCLA